MSNLKQATISQENGKIFLNYTNMSGVPSKLELPYKTYQQIKKKKVRFLEVIQLLEKKDGGVNIAQFDNLLLPFAVDNNWLVSFFGNFIITTILFTIVIIVAYVVFMAISGLVTHNQILGVTPQLLKIYLFNYGLIGLLGSYVFFIVFTFINGFLDYISSYYIIDKEYIQIKRGILFRTIERANYDTIDHIQLLKSLPNYIFGYLHFGEGIENILVVRKNMTEFTMRNIKDGEMVYHILERLVNTYRETYQMLSGRFR